MTSEDVREKIKQTNLERYGVENTSSSKLVREKVKKTNLGTLNYIIERKRNLHE